MEFSRQEHWSELSCPSPEGLPDSGIKSGSPTLQADSLPLIHVESSQKESRGFPGGSEECLQCGRPGFDPWVGQIPCRRKWQPTLVFLPGESHGQRRLVGCSPWGLKESDATE